MLKIDHDNIYAFSYSLLTKKNIKYKIDKKNEQLEFLHLLKKISPSTNFEIIGNYIEFHPGELLGGDIEHKCKLNYLKPIFLIAPFTRHPINLKLKTTTNEKLTVDILRLVYLNILKKFGIQAEINIKKRDFGNEGEIEFKCSIVNKLNPIEMNVLKIKKIRGIAISARLNSTFVNKMVEIVRSELKPIIRNTKIFTDICNKYNSGYNPGYQIILTAENGLNIYFSESDPISSFNKDEMNNRDEKNKYDGLNNKHNENVLYQNTIKTVVNLLKSIKIGGSFDNKVNDFVFSLIAISKDISKIKICCLDEKDLKCLNLLEEFFNFTYKIENDDFIGYGVGYQNFQRKVW